MTGQKIENAVLKICAFVLGGFILLIGLGWGGHRFYRHWQDEHLDKQARAFFEKGDNRSAILSAQRALQINSSNVAACRIIAEISEKIDSPNAVEWRRRLVGLRPDAVEEKIAWARAALKFNQPEVAARAIEQIAAGQGKTAVYHDLAAQLAVRQGEAAEAQSHAAEAIRLEPANPTYRLHFAILALAAREWDEAERARGILGELTNDPDARSQAFRALIEDALRNFHGPVAVEWAEKLKDLPEANFRDQLLALRALEAARDPRFEAEYEKLQRAAAETSDAASDFIAWLNASGNPRKAMEWAARLPDGIRTTLPVPLSLADSFMRLKDWRGLQALVKGADWQERDFVRLALLARALREQGNEEDWRPLWVSAMKKVPHGEQALTLARTAAEWGWKNEAVDLLWQVNEDRPSEEKALRELYAYYSEEKDAAGLYRVVVHLRQLHPEDLDIANNVAQLSLLLNLDAQNGRKLAEELGKQTPPNPAYISTYAFSFYAAGDFKKALKAIRVLSEEQLRQPAVAAYYGLILVAAGERELGSAYLDLVEPSKMLPEEKELIARARRSLAQE